MHTFSSLPKKPLLIIILNLCLAPCLYAQENPYPSIFREDGSLIADSTIALDTNYLPLKYMKSEEELIAFYLENMEYPIAALEIFIQSKVILSVKFDSFGFIEKVEVLKRADKFIAAEVIKHCSKTLSWKLQKEEGNNSMGYQIILPFRFIITADKTHSYFKDGWFCLNYNDDEWEAKQWLKKEE